MTQQYDNGSLLIIISLFLPLIIAAFNLQVRGRDSLRNPVNIILTIANLISVTNLTAFYLNDNIAKYDLIEVLPNFSISFSIEPLGIIFALLANFLWIVTMIYSIGYMAHSDLRIKSRFYVFISLSMFFTLFTAYAGNLFTLFIGYEFITICTYPLVTLYKGSKTKKAGRKYILYLLGTSLLFFFPAILITYSYATTHDFILYEHMLNNSEMPKYILPILLALFISGIGKTAIIPFHSWLPAAMVAPTPVTALLHAVAVVKAGIFCVLKVYIYVIGLENIRMMTSGSFFEGRWLIYLAATSVILSSFAALKQNRIKAILAYSTVTHLSICILAASIGTTQAILAAILHMVAHAFSKITLFFAAGSIYTATHLRDVNEFDGLSKLIPWTMATFTIGALSLMGMPIFAGFISKFFIFSAAWESKEFLIVAVIIASALISASYYLPILHRAFFAKLKLPEATALRARSEKYFSIKLALIISSAGTILITVFYEVILKLAGMLFV